MPAVSVQCPHCSRSYSIDGSLVGRRARCKHCGNPFALRPSDEIAVAGPASGDDLASGSVNSSGLATIPLPEKIGRFLIKQQLGAGACGAVYRAVDPTLDREVALKVPHRELQQDAKAVERFLREAKAAARLQHPHIVPVYETGTDGDSSYIASAFIPGRSLADALDDGAFEPRRAARIVAALADALHAAHQQGIIHRDVKPANVLLDAEDRAHLTDFGLARLADSSAKLTHVSAILGTPVYLAPEQARGQSDKADAASDQYSLGVTLYELLCGQAPFAGPLDVVIFHTLQTPPPPLRDEHPEIPSELETICLKAMSKNPNERYTSCRELAKDLGRWLAGRPTSLEIQVSSTTTVVDGDGPAAAQRPAEPLPTPSDGRTGWGKWTVSAAAAGVLLPLLGVVLYQSTNRGTVRKASARVVNGDLAQGKANRLTESVGGSSQAKDGIDGTVRQGSAPVLNVELPPEKDRTPIKSAVEIPRMKERLDSGDSIPKSSGDVAYDEQMARVQRALAAQDVARANRILAACPADLRGWEWHYCQQLCMLNAKKSVAAGTSPGSGSPAFVHEKVLTIKQPPGPLTNVAFSPDGARIATTLGRKQGALTLWEASSGAQLGMKVVCDRATWALAYSPDGKRIATGSDDATVRIWNATTLTLIESKSVHVSHVQARGYSSVRSTGSIESVAFSPDGRWIASAGGDGTVRTWAIDDENEARGDSAPVSRGLSAAANADKEKGQSEGKAGPTDAKKVRTFGREQSELICDVVWDRDGRWIAGGGANRIKFWDLKSSKELSTIDFLPRCLAQSADGRRLAGASMDPDPTVSVWDVETRQRVLTLKGRKDIAFLDFSPDGKRLATVGRWNVQIWDATSGRQLLELGEPREDDPQDKVFSKRVGFSPDGRRIATVRGDLLRIWSIPAGASAPTTKTAGPESLTTRVGSIKLKRIPAGTFLMGSPDDDKDANETQKPQHLVGITSPFYLGVYEVTQGQYQAVMGNNPSLFSANGKAKHAFAGQSTDRHPVEQVSWLNAVQFCNKLSETERLQPFYTIDEKNVGALDWNGPGYRLPTEAEWEYACRANAATVTRYSFGDDAASLDEYAWNDHNSAGKTHPVGEKRPNGFGLFDMHGNVWEHCWDGFRWDYYQQSPEEDPRGAVGPADRVHRGGSLYFGPPAARSAVRAAMSPAKSDSGLGFRLARSAVGHSASD